MCLGAGKESWANLLYVLYFDTDYPYLSDFVSFVSFVVNIPEISVDQCESVSKPWRVGPRAEGPGGLGPHCSPQTGQRFLKHRIDLQNLV